MELKLKHKYRLILDETWSFGIVGRSGRGVTEVFDIPVSLLSSIPVGPTSDTRIMQAAEVDILTGSMANGLGSAGGFCAGSTEVVAHQVGS